MASAEASAVGDVADEILDGRVIQMTLEGGTSINAACSLVNVLYDTTPLEEGEDLNAYADRLGDTICRVQTGSADAAEARGDFARQCGWQDEEVIDLSFGGATAHPVQLLNKDDVAEAVFQDGAEFTGGELFGSQSTPSAPSLPARDGEDVVQDLFTSSRPLVTSTLERRLSCAMRAEDVPRKDDTYFSFDRMLPFASAENNARTAAHFPDFVNPSDPRSPWVLPGARAAAASVVRRAFAMAGLPAPPTA